VSAAIDPRELAKVAPELFVPDVDRAIRFYAGSLGFELLRREEAGGKATFAVVALGQAIVMLADQGHYAAMVAAIVEPRGRGIDVRFVVPDVDAMYRTCTMSGARIALDIGDRYYGLRDFIVEDPNGYRLRFASPRSA
jgi:catechol 2,3-dioxygenase-like lactoylglutathione lyase family enzyme